MDRVKMHVRNWVSRTRVDHISEAGIQQQPEVVTRDCVIATDETPSPNAAEAGTRAWEVSPRRDGASSR
jgi:hypothetical protein